MTSVEQNTSTTVVALCGPSGVGKGRVKELIKQQLPYSFSEPVVCTTRPKRDDDGIDRRAGMKQSEFSRLVESGAIVLPHQPFRLEDSPWYGFEAESLNAPRILTEVHATILSGFRDTMLGRRSLLLCLIAAQDGLTDSIMMRDGTAASDSDLTTRIEMGRIEVGEITAALMDGAVDAVIDCSIGRRNRGQQAAVDIVNRFLKEYTDER